MKNLLLLTSKQLIRNQLNQKQLNKLLNLNSSLCSRFLSTSNQLRFAHDPLPPVDPKKYGGSSEQYLQEEIRLRPPGPKTIDDFANPDKTGHWISYGWDEVDKAQDRYWMRVCLFFMFTIFFPITTFYYFYEPDHKNGFQWVSREAYLQLHRREKHGLPLIDPDYIPRDKMILPDEKDITIDVHY